MTLKLYS